MVKSSIKSRSSISKFIHDKSGNAAIEYGLLGSLVAVAIIAGTTALGQGVSDTFDQTASSIANNAGAGNGGPQPIAGAIPINIPPSNSVATPPANENSGG